MSNSPVASHNPSSNVDFGRAIRESKRLAEEEARRNQIFKEQANQAKAFRESIPQLKQQTADSLRGDAVQGLAKSIGQVRQGNASRGLLYGGINQGQEAQTRALSSGGLARAIVTANQGIEETADKMDSQAIQTATGVQNAQQAMQNSAYARALAEMNSSNQFVGGMAQMGLLAAMV